MSPRPYKNTARSTSHKHRAALVTTSEMTYLMEMKNITRTVPMTWIWTAQHLIVTLRKTVELRRGFIRQAPAVLIMHVCTFDVFTSHLCMMFVNDPLCSTVYSVLSHTNNAMLAFNLTPLHCELGKLPLMHLEKFVRVPPRVGAVRCCWLCSMHV